MGRSALVLSLQTLGFVLLATAVRAGSPERAPVADPNAGAQPYAAEADLAPPGGNAPASQLEVAARGETLARDAQEELERDYPLYGAACHWLTPVFTAPDERAEILGYLRRGATLRLGRELRGSACDGVWHGVFGGGYVCAGHSVLVGEEPQSFPAAAPPRLYEPLPYDYVKSKTGDLALYQRLPTLEQEVQVTEVAAAARRAGVEPLLASQLAALASKLAPPTPKKAVLTKSLVKAPVKRKAPAPKLRLHPKLRAATLPDVVRGLLQPGFYVSVDEATPDDDSGMLRTVRGDFVRLPIADRVPSGTRRGNLLPQVLHGTLALVAVPNARVFSRDVLTGELVAHDTFRPLEALELADEVIARRGLRYRVALDGRIALETALRFIPAVERPKIVPSQARWIAVSLEQQTLVAYDGVRPVFATLVSTGKVGHETPTGVFRIQSKHVSATMDGEAIGSDDAYSIEDVPWVMYFSGSVALHAAFWHERFGRTRSHGCVNLAPLDAHWLFDWAGPRLPLGFHSVNTSAERPGTFVVVAP